MAAPPYGIPRRTLGRWLRLYVQMIRALLTEYRDTWFYHVFFGFLMPVGLIFFLKFFVGDDLSQERAIFLIGGNMTTSIAFGPTNLLITRLGWGKHNKAFDYWSSLPLPKLGLIMALVTVSLLLSLPALISVWLVGSAMMGLPPSGGVLLLALLPLGALSLAGMGAFLGTYAKDGPTSSMLSNALIGFVTFLSPMMIPLEAMPAALQWTARFVPTTYVANAFRRALAGDLSLGLLQDVLILLLFVVAFMWLVHRKLDWREA